MDEQSERSGWVIAALVIISILFLLPGACGACFFVLMLADWVSNGFTILPAGIDLGPAVVELSSVSLVGSIFLFGLLLRYLRWAIAPKLSLILAIPAAAVSILAGVMLLGRTDNLSDIAILLIAVVIGVLLGAGLPLQFWWSHRSRRKGDEAL